MQSIKNDNGGDNKSSSGSFHTLFFIGQHLISISLVFGGRAVTLTHPFCISLLLLANRYTYTLGVSFSADRRAWK